MSSLALLDNTLPATSPEVLAELGDVQKVLLSVEQIPLRTEHVLHGGLYARTIRLQSGTVILGALIKRATLLIVRGQAAVFIGSGWAELDGYNVIPASAGRKQIFIARATVEMTMIFPTQARTVEEAEAEFTDEADLLTSRRQELADLVIITGE